MLEQMGEYEEQFADYGYDAEDIKAMAAGGRPKRESELLNTEPTEAEEL